MSPAPFTDRYPGAVASRWSEPEFRIREFGGSKTRTIREDTENSASRRKIRKLLNRKIIEQNGICPICLEEFTDYNDVVPDHKDPKGMGGAWRDDHPDNIQATHWWCNSGKGSTRMED
jgi:hypothetical protein